MFFFCAFRYVKAKRATISPNFNFLGQLLEYEKQLQREFVLGLKSESSTAPLFNTSSLSYEQRHCGSDSTEAKENDPYSQKLTPESYCVKYGDVAEVKSGMTHFETTKTSECFISCEKIVTTKLVTHAIPEKQTTALNIKCLPVSSLRELSFTPCQTSTFKSSVKADKILTRCISRNISTSPTKTVTFTCLKGVDEKKAEPNMFAEIRFVDCKNSTNSPDSISPRDTKVFEFDSKSYNRSDSLSTSGLGSEGSDYADSWNEFTSSCERETDILMDDDYPVVPSSEDDLRRNKMVGFEDSYDDSLSLYPKYEPAYDPCRMQQSMGRNYMQTVLVDDG